jgi:hypothetical protein
VTSSVFAPSLTANAPAVAPRRATQKAVESSRATPRQFYVAAEQLAPRPGEERSHEEPEPDLEDEVRLGYSDDLDTGQDEDRAEGDAERALGHLDRHLCAEQHARDRPDQEPRHRVRVDVAVEEVRDARDPEQSRGVEHVGADDLRRRQWVEEQHREPEERPRADRCQADDEAAAGADQDRDHLVARRKEERSVVSAAVHERLHEPAGAAEDERAADDPLECVHAVRPDATRRLDAQQRERS